VRCASRRAGRQRRDRDHHRDNGERRDADQHTGQHHRDKYHRQSPPTSAATTATASATTSVVATATTAATGCVVRPELTVGPYFVDEKLARADIRSAPTTGVVRDGALLDLTFNVSRLDTGGCVALAGATIDLWQCDALGVYSAVAALGTSGQTFLRGYQTTDSGGAARFTTIVPAWYRGRAVHIHCKIRTLTAAGQTYEFTSQRFFTDDFADRVFAQAPYASHGTRDTRNSTDAIYRNGGDQLLLLPVATTQGYAATFGLGLDLTAAAVGAADTNTGGGASGGGGGGRRP